MQEAKLATESYLRKPTLAYAGLPQTRSPKRGSLTPAPNCLAGRLGDFYAIYSNISTTSFPLAGILGGRRLTGLFALVQGPFQEQAGPWKRRAVCAALPLSVTFFN